MPHEVKMPQLGMTQDSGVIVAWLKGVGDAVSEGDALFEVETDKATMEVEASVAGFLTGVQASEGDDVPVGNVIAVIVENEDDVAAHASAGLSITAPKEEPEPAAEPAPAPEPAAKPPAPEPTPSPSPPKPGAKVLASPKAKRLALEKGIDLAQLRAQGVPEPIHAADLSKAATCGQSILTALAPGNALDALLERSQDADRTFLLAAFAAGAWRGLFDSGEVGINARFLNGSTQVIGPGDPGSAVIALVDLCDTRLTCYGPAYGGITLSVGHQANDYVLSLSFSEGALPMPQALALLDDIAARIEDPIRQLL